MSRSESPDRPQQAEEDFLSRWSRRKQAQGQASDQPLAPVAEEEPQSPALTDQDMPPLDSLKEDSDFSGFMSPEVSEGLRKLALRKLFRGAAFNLRDGLDDYDDDFTSFAKLGDLITSDMRFRMAQEAEREQGPADSRDGAEADRQHPVEESGQSTEESEQPARSRGELPAEASDATADGASSAGDDMEKNQVRP